MGQENFNSASNGARWVPVWPGGSGGMFIDTRPEVTFGGSEVTSRGPEVISGMPEVTSTDRRHIL